MKQTRFLCRTAVIALVFAAAGAGPGTSSVQQGVPETPSWCGGAHGAISIAVDGKAWWRAITPCGPAKKENTYVLGQIVGAFDMNELPDPAAVAASVDARVLAWQRLDALAFVLVLLEVPEDRTDAALQMLRSRYPAAVFGRHVIYTAAEGPHETGRQPQRYAERLIGVPEAGTKLHAPVRIGIVDGRPDATFGLDAESITVLPLVEAPAGLEHATAVACLFACTPATGASGLARGAHLVFAAVLAADRSGRVLSDTYTVARGLDALVSRRVDLVHMSLGGAFDAVLARVVARVLPKVRGFVAAAGNGGPAGPAPFPASYPGVIAVAAVDADAKPWPEGTRGPHIAIAAPGVDLWIPVGGGRYFTGTSYAAPFVTAALAARLAGGRSTQASALCMEAIDLPPAGRDDATGCGLVQWPKTDAQ